MLEFARAIGATVQGRFFHIPGSKGGGYITGFSWENGLRMMVRNYYLHEEILLERTNELAEGQDDIIFFLGGIFPFPLQEEKQLIPEQADQKEPRIQSLSRQVHCKRTIVSFADHCDVPPLFSLRITGLMPSSPPWR